MTYFSDHRRSMPASFEILVDGRPVAEEELERTEPRRFFDVTHPLPAELVRGRERVAVRFQAKQGSRVALVFNVRMVRADELR